MVELGARAFSEIRYLCLAFSCLLDFKIFTSLLWLKNRLIIHILLLDVLPTGLTRTHIVNSVRSNTLSLREGAHSLLSLLREHSVPLSILSAGLADVIEEFLVQVTRSLCLLIRCHLSFLKFCFTISWNVCGLIYSDLNSCITSTIRLCNRRTRTNTRTWPSSPTRCTLTATAACDTFTTTSFTRSTRTRTRSPPRPFGNSTRSTRDRACSCSATRSAIRYGHQHVTSLACA